MSEFVKTGARAAASFVLAATVVGTTGCSGPSAHDQASARSAATLACRVLFQLGSQLRGSGQIAGSAIAAGLDKAKLQSSQAARLDRHWKGLADDVASFADTLEGGSTPTTDKTVRVTNDCTPLIGSSSQR